MFDCTAVFHANQQSKAKVVINQGGTWSSKTYSIVQLLYQRAISEKGIVITITGESIPNLKKGAYRDAEKIYNTTPALRQFVKDWNKSERIIHFKNGSLIEFVSNLDEQSAKNGKRDYLFVNEANGINWKVFWQLAIRTRKQVFLDYNPSAPFWAHSRLIGTTPETNELSATVELIISDHRHNCFLTDEDHAKIEGIKDEELWWVYARGATGKVRGVIYKFKKVTAVPDGLPFGFGIDIGYTTDKTAIVKVWYDEQTRDRYYKELLYKSENEILDEIIEKGLNITVHQYIANILKANGCTTSSLVWGDHDKNYSTGLRRLGIPYRMARKGPNTVKQGISKVKECNNYYTEDSTNIDDELKTYVWQTAIDILTGEEITINVPVDGMPDHCLAAIRYFNFSYGMRFKGKGQEEEAAA
ncbi:MAG: phage terminase large subunit [Bacteroidota bacterium]